MWSKKNEELIYEQSSDTSRALSKTDNCRMLKSGKLHKVPWSRSSFSNDVTISTYTLNLGINKYVKIDYKVIKLSNFHYSKL